MGPRNSADVWRERILAQRASGQSIRGWCSASGLHEHSFYMWRLRLKLSPVSRRRTSSPATLPAAAAAAARPMRFAEVIAGPAETMRLRLAGGRELLLPLSMAAEQLARLIRAIEEAS